MRCRGLFWRLWIPQRCLAHLVSYEDADVDGKYARTTLGDSEHVDKLVLAHPPSLLYHFGFDKGYHGVASTQGEGANLDKRLECF